MQNKNLVPVITHFDEISKIETGAWIIKYKGKSIILNSNKSIWRERRFASSALTNHISTVFPYWDKVKSIEAMGFKDARELSKYLQDEGIITIEQI